MEDDNMSILLALLICYLIFRYIMKHTLIGKIIVLIIRMLQELLKFTHKAVLRTYRKTRRLNAEKPKTDNLIDFRKYAKAHK
jgi:hypothetical protein